MIKLLKFSCFFILLLAGFISPSFAGFSGSIDFEQRVFLRSSQYPGQRDEVVPSIVFAPTWDHVSEDWAHTFVFEPFYRLDPNDSRRDHFDIRALNWLYVNGNWEIKTGLAKVFWGVMESNHLVDIINQTDFVEDIDGEDKLGQPMIQLAYISPDYGTLRAFVLPYFRERQFVGTQGRLRFGKVIDPDLAEFDNADKEKHVDVALRYEAVLGDVDLGLAHFAGTSREPRFEDAGKALKPLYDRIDQSSIDMQWTTDATLWKLEAFTRSGHSERFTAASMGVEYTFFDIDYSGVDVGLLLEYHRDDRDLVNAPFTIFQDDVFLGTRVTFNDIEDTQFVGGITQDRDTDVQFVFVEGSQRLGDYWKVEVEGRFFENVEMNDLESAFDQDDFVQLRVSRFF